MKSFPLPDVSAAHRLLRNLAARIPNVAIHRVEQPLVLYGAGHLGRMAADLLQQLDVPIAYALDRLPPSDGLLLGRIPVLTPEQAPLAHRNSHQVAVCVVTAPYEPIYADLVSMGWRQVDPVYDILDAYVDRLPMGNGWFAGALDDEDIGRIEQVLACWHDDYSRAAHLQFLAWRVHREEWHFSDAPVCIDDRYFISPVRSILQPDEYFLDAGAYHGMVIERWLKLTRGLFREILAIEPDRNNAESLRIRIAKFPADVVERIRVLEYALGNFNEIQAFSHDLGLASRLAVQADGEIQVCQLDHLDFPVTFGKIHLEGGELKALEGGVETLQRHRPVLAVTLYHNRDGLWRIPTFLMELLPDYQFLLRLHGWCGTACVLYAIPNERSRHVFDSGDYDDPVNIY